MRHVRLIATAAVVVIVVACTFFIARRAVYQAKMSNDEAGTVVAVQGILKHGVPELPSGLIYWRSPMSHYLDAVSTAILGDREIGWRGASVLAFALTLLLPALVLLRRGHPLLALAWPWLLSLMPAIQAVAWSARMYMVYICFVWLAVAAALLWRPQRFDRRGVAYAVVCGAAALSHQHFVVFTPGLLLLGLGDWLQRGPRTVGRLVRLPMVIAPLVGMALAALLHFGENGWFPRAFPNKASLPTTMGAHRSFAYAVDVLGESLPVPALAFVGLLIAFTLLRRRRPGDNALTAPLVIVLVPAYIALSLMLPNQLDYYVAPLLPIWTMALISVAVVDGAESPTSPRASLIAVAVVTLSAAVVQLLPTPTPRPGLSARLATLTASPPRRDARIWKLLHRWIDARHALVLTSEPEFALVRLPRVDYHVRNYGVKASTPCDRIMDDGVTIPYAHSTCQLDEVVRACDQSGGAALFIGARLGGTIGPSVTRYIVTRFHRIGTFESSEEVYCYGAGCDELAVEFATVRD